MWKGKISVYKFLSEAVHDLVRRVTVLLSREVAAAGEVVQEPIRRLDPVGVQFTRLVWLLWLVWRR